MDILQHFCIKDIFVDCLFWRPLLWKKNKIGGEKWDHRFIRIYTCVCRHAIDVRESKALLSLF